MVSKDVLGHVDEICNSIHYLIFMFYSYYCRYYNNIMCVFFIGPIVISLLKVLDQHINKIYVSPRVLQLCLSYVNQW